MNSTAADEVELSVAERYDIGCPCGCRTRLPWVDDPDCLRHRPLPEPVDWPHYTTQTLGLQPHDRAACRTCQAAA
jgi:hypothetical protein